jgi:protein-S-isoprenylcysteine O-methyltransferase Ste14
MYGFPLTIYLLSGWLTAHLPGVNIYSHDAGHLLEELTGWRGNPHFGPFHIASNILIFAGFILLANAWKVLYEAQRQHRLATTGLYAHIRHPQYVGFVVIMFGFLLQWPTLVTLAMFPILVFMYARLSIIEEREMRATFGAEYDEYAAHVPRFVPRFGHKGEPPHPHPPMIGR